LAATLFTLAACGGSGGVSPPQSSGNGGTPTLGGQQPAAAIPKSYTLVDLGPANGQPWRTPAAVNNSGEVVGNIGSPLSSLPCPPCVGAVPHGWIYKNGMVTQLQGGVATFARDLNNTGSIVGGLVHSSGTESAVLWKPDGTIVSLGTGIASPGSNAEAQGISDSGLVGGYSYNASEVLPTIFNGSGGASDPCGSGVLGYFRKINAAGVGVGDELLSAGGTAVMTCPPFAAIETPSNQSWLNFGFDINNAGTVVGRLSVGPTIAVFHPFMYSHGTTTDLGTLFPNDSSAVGAAFGLNNSGTIVGFVAQSGGTIGPPRVPPVNPRAFVYANGKMVDLNTLLPAGRANWTLITAEDISDNGNIVGTAFVGGYPNGNEHAYLLTPHQ
jgi:probable HAF family extracellular repeat protein